MRLLIENETARLAALNADASQLAALRSLLEQEAQIDRADLARLVKLDFDFHIQIALASKNHIYPLILNSFVAVYTHFTTDFFDRCRFTPLLDEVFSFHRELVSAIEKGQPELAVQVMTALLKHGEAHLFENGSPTSQKE
jgi:GntR family negative regulator for fad regulon and positive regulator of fabA